MNADAGKCLRVAMALTGKSGKEIAEKLKWKEQRISTLRKQESCGLDVINKLANYFEMLPSEYLALSEVEE
jgi:plasmid maintenance system antidote protein VapI